MLLLAELYNVLIRPRIQKFMVEPGEAAAARWVGWLADQSDIEEQSAGVLGVAPGKDDIVFDVAIAGEAEFVVTGDGPLQHLGQVRWAGRSVDVLSPVDFLVGIEA